MSGVERVDGWRCSDGTIFHRTEQAAAEKYEENLHFTGWCREVFGSAYGNNDIAETILRNWQVTPLRLDAEAPKG